MFQQENYDVEPKRKLRSGETSQLMFVVLTLINSGYLVQQAECPHYRVWNLLAFFGSLVWLVFLLLTLVLRFRNKGTQNLFHTAEWIFVLYNVGLFVWANVLYWRWDNNCERCWDFWVFIYILIGYVAVATFILMSISAAIRSLAMRSRAHKYTDGVKHPEYDPVADNAGVEFYEY